MGLVSLLVLLVLIGVALYLIETFIPMAAPLKIIIRVVVVLVVILWLIRTFVGDLPVR